MRRLLSSAVIVALLLAVLPAALPLATVAADTGDYSASVTDKRGDVPTARGDLVRAGLRYGESRIRLRGELRDAGSYKTANWQRGDTVLVWFLDIDGDTYDDHVVSVFNNGRDELKGAVYSRSSAEVQCRPTPSKRGDVFTLRFRHGCVGSPERVRFQAVMLYDRNVSDTSGKSVTTDRAPGGLGWSAWSKQPPQPARIVYATRPPASVAFGRSVSIAATFASDTWTTRRLSLYRRYEGSQRWERIDSAVTPSYSGTVYFNTTVRRPSAFQVRSAGDEQWKPSRSRTANVDVRMAITRDAVPSRAQLGDRVRVSGRVRPANPGGRVVLQKKTADGWVAVKAGKLSPESTFSLVTTPKTSRRHTFRVRTAGDGVRSAGRTPGFKVAIYDVRIRAVQPSDAVAEAQNLNSEYVSIINRGGVPISIADWLVEANLTTAATIPVEYTSYGRLQPGDGVRVHTGSGTPRAGHLYLGLATPMWPPAGVARLYTPRDKLVDELQYGTDPAG